MYEEMMKDITSRARKAARELGILSDAAKGSVLRKMADKMEMKRDLLKNANKEDISRAEKIGKNAAFIDRLRLDDKRIDAMCSMMREVAELDDPLGRVLERNERPNGLIIEKVSVPIGVIGIIYESRPNVTADCAVLCLKSGNAVILRGGSDAISSNKAIYGVMKAAADEEGLVEDAFILMEDTSRALVDEMLKASEGIDLIMPRGGESLIQRVVEQSRIPVIKHYKGICHVYVDSGADLEKAGNICFNAKVQRPGVCNAMETLLVHKDIARDFLPDIASRLIGSDVELRGCERTVSILSGYEVKKASEDDYATEYLDLKLNIKIVDSLDEAVTHIEKFGSHHSDAIITDNEISAETFTRSVDSAAVYVNASTRFTDGGEFGKGAEIGISTDKLHARGPMGINELTTYKYVIKGTGQIRT